MLRDDVERWKFGAKGRKLQAMKAKIPVARCLFVGLLFLLAVVSGGCVAGVPGDTANDDDLSNTNSNFKGRPGEYPRPKFGTVTPVDPP
jgi:hypothetical protein